MKKLLFIISLLFIPVTSAYADVTIYFTGKLTSLAKHECVGATDMHGNMILLQNKEGVNICAPLTKAMKLNGLKLSIPKTMIEILHKQSKQWNAPATIEVGIVQLGHAVKTRALTPRLTKKHNIFIYNIDKNTLKLKKSYL